MAGEDLPAGRQLSLFQNQEAGQRYRYGIYITSSDKPAEEVWRTYRLRASDENIIKEFKQDFALEGFCLDKFYATEAAMLTRALFYNIRRAVPPPRDAERREPAHPPDATAQVPRHPGVLWQRREDSSAADRHQQPKFETEDHLDYQSFRLPVR